MSKAAKTNQAPAKIAESSFGAEDEALGQGLPAHWTLEALEKRVQTLLDSYLSSAKSADAIKSFKDFAAETPGFFDEVVVCALRTALGCKEKQRKMVTDLLGLLYKEQVLDRPSLVRGYATLICTWQALASEKGGTSSVYLAEMLLTCIRSGCIAEEFLTRLPEGFLTAVLRDERAKDTKELEKARDRLHHFKQGIEDKKLLETPLPHIDQAFSVMKEQGMPDCRHEFVKRGLAASLDWPPALRRRCLVLMGQLMEKGILTKEDFQWGVLNLLGQLEDLTLDCPDVAKIAAEHLRGLLAKDLLTTNFVLRCRMLQVGGEAGLKVLGDALEPTSAAPVNLSKVAKAIEASRQDADATGEEPSKESPEDSKEDKEEEKEDNKDGKDAKEAKDPEEAKEVQQNGISKEDPKDDAKAHGPGANGVAKAGGKLSGGISLRPGGGMRPGGSLTGGIGLSGGVKGLSLRPGGGGVALTAPVRESGSNGGGTNAASGYPQEAKKPPAPAPKDDWRKDAAEHQDAKQKQKDGGGKGGRKGDAGRRSGRGGRRDDEDDDVELQLQVSENSWAAQQAKRQEKIRTATEVTTDDVEEEHDKEIARRMKSILNKLTLEKFDDLTRQLCECGISKEAHLKILMTEVFEKATTQHHFVEMYTSLCVHFNDWCSEHLKVGKFKPVLLQQCQESFEANLKDPPKEMSPKKKASASREELEEYEEKRQRYRLRVMGNIRFIGQLLVKRMLASKFLIPCAQELLSEAAPGSHSSLEALASLLTITGAEFDKEDFKYYKQLCDVFKKVEKITKDKSVESRIRFLLQDVLDLRSSGWEDHKVATKKLEAPRKLGEFEGRGN